MLFDPISKVRPRPKPAAVKRVLEDTLTNHFHLVPFDAQAYNQAYNKGMEHAVHNGRIGGAIYDVIHIIAAEMSGADEFVTADSDFDALPPSGMELTVLRAA